jgi:hypothetical protein
MPAPADLEGLPPRPRFDLAKVFKLRDRLVLDLAPFHGVVAEGQVYAGLVEAVAFRIAAPELAVGESLRGIAGSLLTADLVRDTMWRLAGNLGRLRAGVPVYPWNSQPAREWVPVQVLAVDPVEDVRRGRDKQWELTLRVLAGSPCPLRISTRWGERWAKYAAKHAFGFSASFRERPCRDVRELCLLRFLALLEPERSRQGKPGFHRIATTATLTKFNRRFIDKRKRLGGFRCPRGFAHACFECPVGYRECEAACRPVTLLPPSPPPETPNAD